MAQTHSMTASSSSHAISVSLLRQRVRGQVIGPEDPGYNEARKVWNGMIDRHPLFVVKAIDEVDVQQVVRFARECGYPLSIKGGGHNVAGHAVC